MVQPWAGVASRLSTGLAGLDAQLGGGVPAGSVHVVLGEPMNAQELLSYHFATAGSLRGGCQFLSTDYTKEEVLAGIKMVGGKPDRIEVHELPNAKSKWAFPESGKGQIVVYDSYSQAIVQGGWKEAMANLTKAKARARKSGDPLFVSVTGNLHSETERSALRQWADGVFELGFDRQGFGLYPYMKITKMRGVPDSARFLLFKETERGLFMESTKRVF